MFQTQYKWEQNELCQLKFKAMYFNDKLQYTNFQLFKKTFVLTYHCLPLLLMMMTFVAGKQTLSSKLMFVS